MEVEVVESCEVVNGGRKGGGSSGLPRPKIARMLNYILYMYN